MGLGVYYNQYHILVTSLIAFVIRTEGGMYLGDTSMWNKYNIRFLTYIMETDGFCHDMTA